ncbi:MAG: hypothetical protein CO090_06850 [Acidobacteria bacterium CG_4_9_14_3_um_filter_49_7]|nr:MAG: hypothetical protein CO090_06850 [Acidobacteria bacterium CG_4_9_14_3_um_filter_49_7]
MFLPEEGLLLRIFVGDDDSVDNMALYEAIVMKARELNIAGATVLRGGMGFGASSRIHTSKILRLSEDLPIVIEIVDTEEKINSILPYLDTVIDGGMVTLEKVKILKYLPNRSQ